MDTKKLRQKILDLAIRGKLVPQDPNDEPASVLLERIRAEKQQLIKEGKIKAPKGSKACDTSHYENYHLPAGWVWAQMKDICTKIVDGDHNPPKGQTIPTEYIMISSKNINNHSLCSLDEVRYLSAEQFCEADGRTKATPGDIFMTSVASLGRTVIYDGSLNISFQRSVTVISTLVYNKYLQLFIDSPLYQKHIDTNAKGTAQRGFYLNQVEESWVPVPPYAEQEKIYASARALLNMVDEIEDSFDNLRENIDKVKGKVLSLAISGKLVSQDHSDEPAIELLKRINPDFKPCDNSHYPFDIPDGWSLSTFGQLNNHQSKTINPLSEPEKTFELYSVPIFETGKPEILRGIEIGSTKQLVHKGEVLVCKINPHLNRVWVVEHYNTQMNCIASSEWIVFQHPALLPRYALLYFQSPYFRERLMSNVSGVGGSLMRARPSAVDGYIVPIPPINEQRRIVQAVDKLLDNLSSIGNFL